MPITVPDNPKVLTTTYANFKGVDFTNDPSNVWYRRSPDGLNMLPDLDGRPYKRTGWDVEIPANIFMSAGQAQSEPIPDRTYYFELGGYDYIAVFNSIGLFIMTSEDNPNIPQSAISTNNPYTINGNVLTFHNRFVPLSNPSSYTTVTAFDANKAFFFEGGGEAGFYVFCRYAVTGGYKQTLVRLTADSPYFKEVDPYIPKILIMCDKNGVGEFYEPVNMLSEKRMVCYANDEQGVTRFYLPSGEQYLEVHKVETLQANGDWNIVPSSSYSVDSVNHAYLEFTSPPAHVADGDNLRVTYTPVGSAGTIAHRTEHSIGTLTIKKSISYRQRCVNPADVDHGYETPVTTRTFRTWYEKPTTTFTANNIVQGSSTFQVLTGGSWITLDPSNYNLAYTAYNNGVQITPTEAYYTSNAMSAALNRTTTEWVSGAVQEYEGEERGYYYRTVVDTYTLSKSLRHTWSQYYAAAGVLGTSADREAFWGCSKSMIFGNGIINQVFLTATNAPNFSTRVWYSGATDPTYFADDNYIEVGASDKPIMGLLKVGQYLGIVKGGSSTNESIYLAYPTSYEDITTYAVKQSISGIGAVSKGAFNILNTEPLFLSSEGVMGIDETETEDRRIRNRSVFINKRLCAEQSLDTAVSFVYNGMYWLAFPNGHCYVLDGAQKNSWANEKTNMQYEAYYLENVPAQCFAKYNGSLWFSDFNGNLCRFKTQKDEHPYRDDYYVGKAWLKSLTVPEEEDGKYYYDVASLRDYYNSGEVECSVGDVIVEASESYENYYYYVIEEVLENNGTAVATRGCPIKASWTTLADDDGAVHYFKSLQKKGCLVSLLPDDKTASGVDVYLRKDEKEPIYIGRTDESGHWLPFEYYIKKKVKKYKRLQIICENNRVDESFGIDQIIKMYTVGNFSKNKR